MLGKGHTGWPIEKTWCYINGEIMKSKKASKPTLLDVISKILDSDLPMSTRNEITRFYMLPRLGRTQAIIQEGKVDIGVVERPNAEEIRIENDPRLKGEEEDTTRLMSNKKDDGDDD